MEGSRPPEVLRFGPYEIRLRTQELFKHGSRLKLPPQAFQVLRILLERRGELVTREDLRQTLWSADTFVDFDHGLNNAVRRIRDALNDSVDSPLYVETLPRLGYRFIGEINQELSPVATSKPSTQPRTLGPSRLAWIVLTAVGGQALVISAWLASGPRHQSFNPTPVPFTALPGNERTPTFSPDGSHLAFAWDGDPGPNRKGFDLYVKAIGSETLQRLTNHPSVSLNPAWSPDGAQIAFYRISGADTGIYVVPALGGLERKLRSTHVQYGNSIGLSWSPDGKTLAFVDTPSGEDERVSLLSMETLETKQIPHEASCITEWDPAFSHGGTQLAYVCWQGETKFGIYLLTLSQGAPRLLTVFNGWHGGIAWKREDKGLILGRMLASAGELDEVPLAGGSLHRLAIEGNSISPAITPTVRKLAYTSYTVNTNVWRRDLRHPSSSPKALIWSTREQANAQYSPDGKHIAFESTRSGAREIWITDSDGANLVQLTHLNNLQTGTPRWSPDSKKIVFDSRASGAPGIYVLDISEQLPRRIVTNDPGPSVPSWSSDSNWIYFLSKDGRIFRCPSTGGEAEVLTTRANLYGPLSSPDSQSVYFSSFFPSAALFSLSLREPGPGSPVPGMPPISDCTLWTLTPSGIYFVPKDDSVSVYYLEFSTRRTRLIFRNDHAFADGLSVSPDGQWILYSQFDQGNSDIMLVDQFH